MIFPVDLKFRWVRSGHIRNIVNMSNAERIFRKHRINRMWKLCKRCQLIHLDASPHLDNLRNYSVDVGGSWINGHFYIPARFDDSIFDDIREAESDPSFP